MTESVAHSRNNVVAPGRGALVYGLFFLSGAVGLVYEVVWSRVLALQVGNSAWALATVVSTFMAGLALGSAWAGRRCQRWTRPLFVYGLAEVGIAFYGALSLSVLTALRGWIRVFYPWAALHPTWFASLRFLSVGGVLVLPTFLMGASLPALVVGCSSDGNFETTVGRLYGVNTSGAACGAFVSGFGLLLWLGIRQSLRLAAGLGLFIGLTACLIGAGKIRPRPTAADAPAAAPRIRLLVCIAFVSGLASLYLEICWTRLLAPLLGSSTHAFTIILTIFLIAVALSGPLAPFLLKRFSDVPAIIGGLLLVGAGGVAAALRLTNQLPDFLIWLATRAESRIGLFFLAQAIVSAVLFFVPVLAIGAVLPLATAAVKRQGLEDGPAVGWVYAANTVGSVIGAIGAGFWALPTLGPRNAVIACGELLAGTAVLSMMMTRDRWQRLGRLTAVLAFAVAVALMTSPAFDRGTLQRGLFRHLLTDPRGTLSGGLDSDLIYSREGLSCTVSVYRSPQDTYLKMNGKTDASLRGDLETQYLLAHLPLLAQPAATQVCVVGLGSGATARAAAAHPIERLDVIEIEPAVMDTLAFFTPINEDVQKDPRFHLHAEDGRTFLMYTPMAYDVIISEPSNPWIAGVATLFTVDFYRAVARALKPNGVFCQWIQQYEMSEQTRDGMLRTLTSEFSDVVLFSAKTDLICLAANHPLVFDRSMLDRWKEPEVASSLAKIGIRTPADLALRYTASFPNDPVPLVEAPLNTDDRLWLEYRAPLEMYQANHPRSMVRRTDGWLAAVRSLFFRGASEEGVRLELANALRGHPEMVSVFGDVSRNASGEVRRRIARVKEESERAQRLILADERRAMEAQRLMNAGHAQQAFPIFQDVASRLAPNAELFRVVGNCALRLGRWKEARFWFQKAVGLDSNDFLALTSEAVAALKQQRTAEAEQLLRRAIAIDPMYGPPRALLVGLLEKQNRRDESRSEWRQAVESLSPSGQKDMEMVLSSFRSS